jgi:hypothetical protein
MQYMKKDCNQLDHDLRWHYVQTHFHDKPQVFQTPLGKNRQIEAVLPVACLVVQKVVKVQMINPFEESHVTHDGPTDNADMNNVLFRT